MTTPHAIAERIPHACPACGALSLAPSSRRSTLLAVCDVLVVKALEQLGKFLVRKERSRFREKGTRPWHIMHTLWPADDDKLVEKVLKGAWDVVPALVDVHGVAEATPAQVIEMLDSYVRDLVLTGTPHHVDHLRYRFESRLGLPVYDYSEDECFDDD